MRLPAQPVEATLYLKGEMECALMGRRFHRGFTAVAKTYNNSHKVGSSPAKKEGGDLVGDRGSTDPIKFIHPIF
jgi:hypothetical protein